MEERENGGTSTTAISDGKRRCAALIDRLNNTNNSKLSLSSSPKSTLLRLIHAELNFLRRLSATPHPSPLSFNIGHLEAVVHILQQPFITAVSRVCKVLTLAPSSSVYVDIVCSLNGNPVWFVVSDRNPRYISWEAICCDGKIKGLKEKVQQVVDGARGSPVALRPWSVLLFFSNGLDENVCEKLIDEFGGVLVDFVEPFSYEEVELDDDWMDVAVGRSFSEACVVEIKIDRDGGGVKDKSLLGCTKMNEVVSCKNLGEYSDLNVGASLHSLISGMKCWCCSLDDSTKREAELVKKSLGNAESKLVNFDTTAMVAIVSGISNGGAEKLLAKPESELRSRFKGNYEFVIAQVDSENQNPIHMELSATISGYQGIVCESVCSEFQELISICGGPKENLRAKHFLKFLKVVPDCPSTRLMGLPTTRKLALKNKVVFGTGDYWFAPTVTANMGFVRAVSQTGMSLSVIEHRPRALIGD